MCVVCSLVAAACGVLLCYYDVHGVCVFVFVCCVFVVCLFVCVLLLCCCLLFVGVWVFVL